MNFLDYENIEYLIKLKDINRFNSTWPIVHENAIIPIS